jgi:hypothetical protein
MHLTASGARPDQTYPVPPPHLFLVCSHLFPILVIYSKIIICVGPWAVSFSLFAQFFPTPEHVGTWKQRLHEKVEHKAAFQLRVFLRTSMHGKIEIDFDVGFYTIT